MPHDKYLLPNRKPGMCMGRTTLNAALDRMGYDDGFFSPHSARTTACTLLNEAGFPADVIERQLAHQDRNAVRRTYNKAQYLAERSSMMAEWSRLVYAWASGNNVVPIKRAVA